MGGVLLEKKSDFKAICFKKNQKILSRNSKLKLQNMIKRKMEIFCFSTFVPVYILSSKSPSFHLVRVLSRQWRLINFRMHRSDDCLSWNFIVSVNRWAHVSFWFWKKLNFLHFLPCKEIISCMFYLKDYQLQWISFWLNQFIRKTGQKHWNR